MAKVTVTIEYQLTQEEWDVKFKSTSKKLKDMGGGQTPDDLPDGVMVSEPESGEHKIYGLHRNADGKLEYVYEDQPKS